MVLVARAVVALAARRCESRGAHWRTDYPVLHPEWRARTGRPIARRLGRLPWGPLRWNGLHEAVSATLPQRFEPERTSFGGATRNRCPRRR